MTVVRIRKSEVKKIIGHKKDSEIDHVLSMMSTAVERMDDEIIDVEVAPNRPDMLSEAGVLRALKSFSGKSKGLSNISVKSSGYTMLVDKSYNKDYPYAISCIVKNLKLNDEKIKELIDIQEKLGMSLLRKRKKGGIGLYPLDKINFPVVFKALHPEHIKFRPLDFPNSITAKQILSQHPTGREYGHLVQEWDKYPVFVDNKGNIMSMPPIINSHEMGRIDETTKNIFIEATGTDYELLKKVMNIVVFALSDMGGKVYSIECVQGSGKKETIPSVEPQKMVISIERTNKLLGLNLKESQIKDLLGKMGMEYNKGRVLVPAYRNDVMHEVDLIEDVAIAYGYDNLVPNIPEISTIGEIDKNEIFKNKVAELLVGLGLLETSSLHLTTKQDQLIKTGMKNRKFIEVKNSKTEYNILRSDLSHYMLKIISENSDVEYPQEIFQMGRIFNPGNLGEEEHLSIACTPANYTRIKQVLDYISRMLELEFSFTSSKEAEGYFIEGRVAEVLYKGKKIGQVGEVHPKVLSNFKIKMPVALLEINLEEIFKSM